MLDFFKRYSVFFLVLIMTCLGLVLANHTNPLWWGMITVLCLLSLLGIWDVFQSKHAILRNFPLLGHFRYLLESVRPEIQQYFIEDDIGGAPFSRQVRSLIYKRSKNLEGVIPFGTELDVNAADYFYVKHSLSAHTHKHGDLRVMVGGKDCRQPYSASILNISAMSFGALGAKAIESLNRGAKLGNFFHVTGEGGVSPYHLAGGGDLVWQIGTGYFGCRNSDGTFNEEDYIKTASKDAIKMIELKISQGAKPGHGGILPAAKVNKEIANTRNVNTHEDCISPPSHSAFSNPLELCYFIDRLRKGSGAKPVGFKICIGFESEFYSICKAMIQTGIAPDFITVDGGEGGTGAAPLEFSDHMGMPMLSALHFVNQTLIGAGLRDEIRLAAAGKISSGATIAQAAVLGADWCNAARSFMLSIGCIHAQRCHTNTCPAGIATTDSYLQRGINVDIKANRVNQFHSNTVKSVAEILGACGLNELSEMTIDYMSISKKIEETLIGYTLAPGSLIDGQGADTIQKRWDKSSAEVFSRA